MSSFKTGEKVTRQSILGTCRKRRGKKMKKMKGFHFKRVQLNHDICYSVNEFETTIGKYVRFYI